MASSGFVTFSVNFQLVLLVLHHYLVHVFHLVLQQNRQSLLHVWRQVVLHAEGLSDDLSGVAIVDGYAPGLGWRDVDIDEQHWLFKL